MREEGKEGKEGKEGSEKCTHETTDHTNEEEPMMMRIKPPSYCHGKTSGTQQVTMKRRTSHLLRRGRVPLRSCVSCVRRPAHHQHQHHHATTQDKQGLPIYSIIMKQLSQLDQAGTSLVPSSTEVLLTRYIRSLEKINVTLTVVSQ